MSVETLDIFGNNQSSTLVERKKTLQTLLINGVIGLLETAYAWNERQRSRHQLAQLDDRMLADIGLDRSFVAQEIEKPFWVK